MVEDWCISRDYRFVRFCYTTFLFVNFLYLLLFQCVKTHKCRTDMLMRGSFIVPDMTEQGLVQVQDEEAVSEEGAAARVVSRKGARRPSC